MAAFRLCDEADVRLDVQLSWGHCGIGRRAGMNTGVLSVTNRKTFRAFMVRNQSD